MRGAWVEIARSQSQGRTCRSLPVRGAWVEIMSQARDSGAIESLPVRGAWVEMRVPLRHILANLNRRSPCGERGLKYFVLLLHHYMPLSLPVRGAWVEMRC